MKHILIILLILPLLLEAKTPGEVLKDCKSNVSVLKKKKKEEAILIYNWLAYTTETRMHQLREATDNQLFVHENGRYEVVYDSDGKIVDDDINNGSLNYAHPVKDPANHFVLDIFPWVIWGYSKKDPTSIDERIIALSEALGGGLVNAQENRDKFVRKKLSRDELEGIAVIYEVLEKGGIVESVFQILNDSEFIPDEPYEVGEGLTKGLLSVMK